jgi:heptosyltransferase-2
LVVQTAFLGDVVLTTPLLSALAAKHGPVDVLVRPEAVALVETLPTVRDAIGYDKRGHESGLGAWWRLSRRLAGRRYRTAYLPHRSLRSAALARAAGIPERIGFDDAPAAWLYTRRVLRSRGLHESERLLALAGPRPLTPPPIQLALTEDDRAEAYAWLAARGIGDGFAALAPGSVWATKRWPGFVDLVKLIRGRVVVVGGADDADRAQELVDVAPDRVVSAAGLLPIRVSAALLERAGVLVTNDSAPLHLASAVGTPTVAVFGPTVPAFGFGPKAPRSAIVERTDLSCRPCSDHGPERCPLGHHRCMREIPATVVRDAIHELIE